jgi:DNA-binding transcriptional regulator YbjK
VSSQPAFTRADPDARRASLIAACGRVLAREGAGGASVRAIAVEAGVSPGLVGHYFAGIDSLIAETYAAVGQRVDAAMDAALAVAGTDPQAQLAAYVTASLTPPIADPDLLATWIAFWSLVRSRPEIAAQHAGQYGDYRARLEGLLAACGVGPDTLHETAIAITALVDGLWLELCLSPEVLSRDAAARIARAALARLV